MPPESGKRKYPCPKDGCTKSFTRKAGLQNHLNGPQHANEKPFQCSQCPTRFVRSDDRRKHEERKHRQIARFVCHAEGCDVVCYTKYELNRHQERAEHLPGHQHAQGFMAQEVGVFVAAGEYWNEDDTNRSLFQTSGQMLLGLGTSLAPRSHENKEAADRMPFPDEEWSNAHEIFDASVYAVDHSWAVQRPPNSPEDAGLVQGSKSTAVQPSVDVQEDEVETTLSKLDVYLSNLSFLYRPLSDSPAVADDSVLSVEGTNLVEQLMGRIRQSWHLYDLDDIDVDLDRLYARLVNRLRRNRELRVDVLERQVAELIQKMVTEGLKRRDALDLANAAELHRELIHFWDSGLADNMQGVKRPGDDEVDPQVQIFWYDLAQMANKEERQAKIQMEMRSLLLQQRRRRHDSLATPLTLEWLEESIRAALDSRTFCKSIVSGHTLSTLETVRAASSVASLA